MDRLEEWIDEQQLNLTIIRKLAHKKQDVCKYMQNPERPSYCRQKVLSQTQEGGSQFWNKPI